MKKIQIIFFVLTNFLIVNYAFAYDFKNAVNYKIEPNSFSTRVNNRNKVFSEINKEATYKTEIKIASPSIFSKISFNKFDSFSIYNPNIEKSIIDNSDGAKLIVIEVIGNEASYLYNAHFEIKGKKADIIFANPNGYYINGVFSNAGKVDFAKSKISKTSFDEIDFKDLYYSLNDNTYFNQTKQYGVITTHTYS